MVAAGLSPTLQRREEPLEETSCLSDVPVLREALLPVLLGWWEAVLLVAGCALVL